LKNIIYWTYSEINGYTFWLKSRKNFEGSASNINFLPPIGKDLIEFEAELFKDKINYFVGLLLMQPDFNMDDFEIVKFEE
jgi:hypothetical protein